MSKVFRFPCFDWVFACFLSVLSCLFLWLAFDCVLFSFSVCLLVAFRLGLLPVMSAYLFLLSIPSVLHGGGKYQVCHNGTPDILSSVECSDPKNGMRHE